MESIGTGNKPVLQTVMLTSLWFFNLITEKWLENCFPDSFHVTSITYCSIILIYPSYLKKILWQVTINVFLLSFFFQFNSATFNSVSSFIVSSYTSKLSKKLFFFFKFYLKKFFGGQFSLGIFWSWTIYFGEIYSGKFYLRNNFG